MKVYIIIYYVYSGKKKLRKYSKIWFYRQAFCFKLLFILIKRIYHRGKNRKIGLNI